MPVLGGFYGSDFWMYSYFCHVLIKPASLNPVTFLSFIFRALKGSLGCQESKERKARGWVSEKSPSHGSYLFCLFHHFSKHLWSQTYVLQPNATLLLICWLHLLALQTYDQALSDIFRLWKLQPGVSLLWLLLWSSCTSPLPSSIC